MKLIVQSPSGIIKKFFPFTLFLFFLYFSSFLSVNKIKAAGQDCCNPGWNYEPPAAQCQNSVMALTNTNCVQGTEECVFSGGVKKWVCQTIPTLPPPTSRPTIYLPIIPKSPTFAPLASPTPIINFNKLRLAFLAGSLLADPNLSIGLIISKAFTYIFVIAGLLLLFLLISGGFQMMFGAADPKGKEAASKKISDAFIGFIIIFVAYWLVQIVEVILGISILK